MPSITFSHPSIEKNLTVQTGANQIEWSYTLNTVAYPTYGGEVVQILSTSVDDLQIQGEVKSYAEMEDIYRWFLEYSQLATSGSENSDDKYNEKSVTMSYPHRSWKLSILPKSLPSMRYGRDVVIPSWTLVAAIRDAPEINKQMIDSYISGELENWKGKVTADIGYRPKNPFSDPNSLATKEEAELYPGIKDIPGISVMGEDTKEDATIEALTGVAKQMLGAFQSLLDGKLSDVLSGWQDASQPVTTVKKTDDKEVTKTSKSKDKK